LKVELKGKSGIYGFLSKTTGNLYIGSSINLFDRFSDHIYGTQSNIKLQNAINKYNLYDFIFLVFEYRDPKDLIALEQYYLDSLKPEFNILKTTGSSLGFQHSEESKVLMSLAKSGENNPMFGKTFMHSIETKALMSSAQSKLDRTGENNPMFGKIGELNPMFGKVGELNPMFGKTHSKETKLKMSETHGSKIKVINKETNETIIYFSNYKAAEALGCSEATIRNYIKNNKLYKGKYFFIKDSN